MAPILPSFQLLQPRLANRKFKPYTSTSLAAFIWASLERDNYRIAESLHDNDRLDVEDSVFCRCVAALELVNHSELRSRPHYHPLAVLLSTLSLEVESISSGLHQESPYLLFLPWADPSDCREHSKPSIIAIEATENEVLDYVSCCAFPPRIVHGAPPDWRDVRSFAHVDKRYSCRDLANGKLVVQILAHYWNASRYQTHMGAFSGVVAHPDGYRIVQFFLDHAEVSVFHEWKDVRPLVHFVFQLYSAPLSHRELEVPNLRQRLVIPSLHSIPGYPLHRNFTPDLLFVDEASKSTYRLLDLYRGQGWGRKAYVGLGLRISSPFGPPAAVFKHQWGDGRKSAFEDRMLRKAEGCPGVVRICEALTPKVPLSVWEPEYEGCGIPRQSRLIALSTIGESLSACQSILELLKAMYDLVEVHRILVEEHGILHRDISWGNVLINHEHLEGPPDKMDGHGFIGNVLGISADERRIHVVLADFDNAIDMHEIVQHVSERTFFSGHEDTENSGTAHLLLEAALERPDISDQIKYDIVGKVGTPATIAEHLSRKDTAPPNLHTIGRDDLARFNDVADAAKLFSDSTLLRHRGGALRDHISTVMKTPKLKTPLSKFVIHKPIHDAESIYWLIVLFLLRAWPVSVPAHAVERSKEERSSMLDALMGNRIDGGGTRTSAIQTYTEVHWRQLLPAPLGRLGGMLYLLGRYFSLTWHHADVGCYDLHGHDFLQLVLLREIEGMISRRDEDPTGVCIPLRDKPLPIYSTFPIADFSTHLSYAYRVTPEVGKDCVDRDGHARTTYDAERKLTSNEGSSSPLSDSFSFDSIVGSTDSLSCSSRRSSTTTISDPVLGDATLEWKIGRILQAKHLEKQRFTNGESLPLAPGFNH